MMASIKRILCKLFDHKWSHEIVSLGCDHGCSDSISHCKRCALVARKPSFRYWYCRDHSPLGMEAKRAF